jgi:hypothetical protein
MRALSRLLLEQFEKGSAQKNRATRSREPCRNAGRAKRGLSQED